MGNNSLGLTRDQLIPGVWDQDLDEHPEKEFIFISKVGYICEIKRSWDWTYCGYVYLPKNHPFYEKTCDEIENLIKVHGGLTFGDSKGVFGFDCSHKLAGDISPGDKTMEQKNPELFPLLKSLIFEEPHYWTWKEVKKEIEDMANQFKRYERMNI